MTHPADPRGLLMQVLASDFLSFVQKFFELLFPGTRFEANWHLEAMAAEVDRLMAGTNRDLLITMPPRFLKSFVMSVALPAFLMGRFPSVRIVVVSYSEQLAESLASDTLRIMESELYREIFPETKLTKRTQRDIKTSAGGRRFATTVGGSVTGLGGEWIIVDDPLNASHAYSDSTREQVNRFFDETLATRADNLKTAKFVVVMQRLHEDDLAGHVLERAGWRHLKLQARATEPQLVDIGGGRIHSVKPGDLLHEARLDEVTLERLGRQMGSNAVAAQFQQDPLPAAGNQIKREWLGRYTVAPSLDDAIIAQSWDTASKTGVANDNSACTTWALKNHISYCLHSWCGKVEFPALGRKVVDLYNQFGATHLLIEDASSGSSLIQELKVTSSCNVIPCRSSLDKRARVDAISGALEAGRVLFPKDAPWLAELERELLAFPGGKHDDQVDSVTQYVMWANERATRTPLAWDFGSVGPTMDSIAHHVMQIRNHY